MHEDDPQTDDDAVRQRLIARAKLAAEFAKIRAKTPKGPRRLAEELVRESRDER
jgi:hypothetical protein